MKLEDALRTLPVGTRLWRAGDHEKRIEIAWDKEYMEPFCCYLIIRLLSVGMTYADRDADDWEVMPEETK